MRARHITSLGLGSIAVFTLAYALWGCGGAGVSLGQSNLSTKSALGKALFFDTTLSSTKGMSCATCHSPKAGFTDPRLGQPTSQGALKGLFGFRNAPSAAYAAFSPAFQESAGAGAIGGQFWDGRSTDLAAQAKLPLLNPIEMANPNAAAVVAAVQKGPYASAIRRLYGASIFNNSAAAYSAITDAIAEFEKTPEVSPFSSKYDAYLAGKATLTAEEQSGLAVFNGKGLCFSCHPSAPGPGGAPPLFTDFSYSNIGLPKNPNNPYYLLPAKFNPQGANFIDIGLQGTTGRATDAGRFKTPTLRNIARTAPYFHNGLFNRLADVVNFYNSRDLGGFGPPEVAANVETSSVGNLSLTDQECADLVAFMKTLTDGYFKP